MTDSSLEGKRLAKAGDFEGALTHLKSAAEETPGSPDAWLALGACYFRLDRNDDFREAIRRALAIDSNHAPTLRFLKKTTGAEVIPAPDTGREKIFMEEGGTSLHSSQETEKPSSGCLGLALVGIAALIISGFCRNPLDFGTIFRLYY